MLGALAVCPFELMVEKYMCMVVWERAQTAGLGGSGSAVRGHCIVGSIAWGNWGGYAVEVLCLPDVPVQCRPIRVGEDGLGQGRGVGSVVSSSVVCS